LGKEFVCFGRIVMKVMNFAVDLTGLQGKSTSKSAGGAELKVRIWSAHLWFCFDAFGFCAVSVLFFIVLLAICVLRSFSICELFMCVCVGFA
jgi:hypothetical protein